MRFYVLALTRNPLSLLGAALTTASAIVILTLFGLGLVGYHGGPYVGILTYIVFPSFFVLGLLLIPIGAWRQRVSARRALERGEDPPRLPVIDLNRDRVRRAVLLVLAATALNVAILAIATYKGIEVVESTEFCGSACHKVMAPELAAYERSPHASVACVACHIGPGADWFVKSKLSGAWQVAAVSLDLYPRPIPTPVESLRPARETCEDCHTPGAFAEDRLRVIPRYAEDEANTETKTVLLMKVGGVRGTASRGIHWHADPRVSVRYRSDTKRETILEIESRVGGGLVATFAAEDAAKSGNRAEDTWRSMDCTDCHNRSGHRHRAPAEAVDEALGRGTLDRTLPYLKREAVKVLQVPYASHEEARRRIPETIRAFYEKSYPDRARDASAAISDAGEALAEIYCSNVFPEMNVSWGTYPDQLGHQSFPGCFRCHDESHKTSDGRTISQDCSICHAVLAVEEVNPAVLAQLAP